MNRWLVFVLGISAFMLLGSATADDDWTKNADFVLEDKLVQSIQDGFKPPQLGFFYRYDGNPIYQHPNEYLIIGDGQTRYVSYDPDLFTQISMLVGNGHKDESDIKKNLHKIDISADDKACPKVDSMLADLYQSTVNQVASEKYPQKSGIHIGGSFEYKIYFSNWKGNRFIYEFEDKTFQLNKDVHSLIDYIRSCGAQTKQ